MADHSTMEMIPMPRRRPDHLQLEFTRHGKPVWYLRIGHGLRTRVRGLYGTPEFQAQIDAWDAGEPITPTDTKFNVHTFGWLTER